MDLRKVFEIITFVYELQLVISEKREDYLVFLRRYTFFINFGLWFMVSLLSLFGVFAKIGAFTIGGGYAMLPLVEQELTGKGWISEDDMQELIVLAQSAPGILAVNLAIFVGNKLRGLRGSVVATIGAVLPSFVIILAIASCFDSFGNNALVVKFFQGVRPVAVALILAAGIKMALKSCKSLWMWLVFVLSLGAVALLRLSAIWVVVSTIAVAGSLSALRSRKDKRAAMEDERGVDADKSKETGAEGSEDINTDCVKLENKEEESL